MDKRINEVYQKDLDKNRNRSLAKGNQFYTDYPPRRQGGSMIIDEQCQIEQVKETNQFGTISDKDIISKQRRAEFPDADFDYVIEADNRRLASLLCGILNNADSRKQAYLPIIKAQYRKDLERFNVCFQCKKPIRYRNAEIRFNNELADNLPLYRSIEYGVIKSHYRVIPDKKDANKFVYRYIDGSGRNIASRKAKFGLSEFYNIDTGESITPNKEFRILRQKCNCW